MLYIRGASPPQGTPFCSIEESFQPLFENQPSSTYYEYERDYRYDSDCDNYSRRRSSPPVKRRRDRGRKRHGRQSRKSPPERRSGRRRSNSVSTDLFIIFLYNIFLYYIFVMKRKFKNC